MPTGSMGAFTPIDGMTRCSRVSGSIAIVVFGVPTGAGDDAALACPELVEVVEVVESVVIVDVAVKSTAVNCGAGNAVACAACATSAPTTSESIDDGSKKMTVMKRTKNKSEFFVNMRIV